MGVMDADLVQMRLQLKDVENKISQSDLRHGAHERSDDERYGQIKENTAQILNQLTDMARKLEKGFERVHNRIDESNADARHKLGSAISNVQGEFKLAIRELDDKTATALDAVIKRTEVELTEVELKTKSAIQVWVLGGCVIILLGVSGFFLAQRFEVPNPISPAGAAEQTHG